MSFSDGFSRQSGELGQREGPGLLRTPALTGGGQAFLLPRRWPEYLVSMSGGASG